MGIEKKLRRMAAAALALGGAASTDASGYELPTAPTPRSVPEGQTQDIRYELERLGGWKDIPHDALKARHEMHESRRIRGIVTAIRALEEEMIVVNGGPSNNDSNMPTGIVKRPINMVTIETAAGIVDCKTDPGMFFPKQQVMVSEMQIPDFDYPDDPEGLLTDAEYEARKVFTGRWYTTYRCRSEQLS
jgi:hypothetical protein